MIYSRRTLREITIHDTLSGTVREITPREPGKIGMYVCGPTVYGPVHVGNARPFVVFSLFKRFLEHEGYDVTFVANITDVNDKIYAAAHAEGIGSAQLAREMGARYIADTNRLGLGRPDHEPLASATIDAIVSLIADLVEKDHAYAVDGDVYFSVRKYPGYGELSHRKIDDMDQGEGVEGAGRKRDPLDFALWKGEKEGEDTSWESPWGPGRPGWHIECSAMAEELLGLEFEIHGGGSDLIFPHHENEEAQTHAARGVPLAQLWMHNGMIRLDQQKMAKSVGNIFLLGSALDAYGRDALIMYFVGGHYRQPVEFDDERLREASRFVDRIRETARGLDAGAPSPAWSASSKERFFDALAHDFNTPRALATVAEWVTAANRELAAGGGPVGGADLREMLDTFGLANLLEPDDQQAPPEVVELLERREQARAERDFAESDRLREEIRAAGWEVRDGPQGPGLVPLRPA
ncbi:MAG TPA: cysteine--tRNA ligase [Solirubrobacteraceae bacterium]|nr:cysteine--tRNA ligase [Solirubrobacteraceae bacterium]